jgi:sugar/nucleoside kinase (ribokinase family)
VEVTTSVQLSGKPPPIPLDVVGVGNALVDVIATVDESLVEQLGLVKGAMTLVDLEHSARIHEAMGETVQVSGGSAANTIAGIASLGGRAGFAGKVADDELGRVFRDDLEALSVTVDLAVAPSADGGTGRCHVLVTPDAEKTMATHLGVANSLVPGDLDGALFTRSSLTYLEGYLFDLAPAKQAVHDGVEVAHAADGLVALSLSDAFCVERHRRDLLDLVTRGVDVVLANEAEALSLFKASNLEAALDAFAELGVLAAVTLGERGAAIVVASGVAEVPAHDAGAVVDVTGAGDQFAAGFLFGLASGADPIDAARLGSLCAAEVISHLGGRPEADLAGLAVAEGLA